MIEMQNTQTHLAAPKSVLAKIACFSRGSFMVNLQLPVKWLPSRNLWIPDPNIVAFTVPYVLRSTGSRSVMTMLSAITSIVVSQKSIIVLDCTRCMTAIVMTGLAPRRELSGTLILSTKLRDSLTSDGEANAKAGRWALGVGRSGVKSTGEALRPVLAYDELEKISRASVLLQSGPNDTECLPKVPLSKSPQYWGRQVRDSAVLVLR